MKTYKYTYDFYYDCVFQVDESEFTEEHAQAFLEFYSWDWDFENDLRDEALRKMAQKCVYLSQEYNVEGIKDEIKNVFEAYIPLDGSIGVTLESIDHFSFNDIELELEKS